MNVDTFDGSRPILVSLDTIRDIEGRLNVPFNGDENRVLNGLSHFMDEYIFPNMFPIIVISILCIYLLIKYILKQDREEKEETEKKENELEKARNRRAKRIYRSMINTHNKSDNNLLDNNNDDNDNLSDDENSSSSNDDSSLDDEDTRAEHKKYVRKVSKNNQIKHTNNYQSNEIDEIDEIDEIGENNATDKNIADYISDDYLLTDTDEENSNNFNKSRSNNINSNRSNIPQISEANPMMSDMIAIHHGGLSTPFSMQTDDNITSIDKAARLIFGK